MQEPKAGRRVVSKGAYVKVQAGRVGWFLYGLFLRIMALVLFLLFVPVMLLCVIFDAVIERRSPVVRLLIEPKANKYTMLSIVSESFQSAIQMMNQSSRTAMQKSAMQDPGVPLTRANTADLPAPDSLVRSAAEPAQAQEGVLLRAASGETQEKNEAQLLRASAEGE